jgi:hypothetical protein
LVVLGKVADMPARNRRTARSARPMNRRPPGSLAICSAASPLKALVEEALMPRLGVVDVIGVFVTMLVVPRQLESSSLYHNAMLVTGHAISVVERFARVRAGVEISFAA